MPPPHASWHAHALEPGLIPAPAGRWGTPPLLPTDGVAACARKLGAAECPRARGRGGGGPLSEVRASLRQRHMRIRIFRSPTRCCRSRRAWRRWCDGPLVCARALGRMWWPAAVAAEGARPVLAGRGDFLRRSVGACGSASPACWAPCSASSVTNPPKQGEGGPHEPLDRHRPTCPASRSCAPRAAAPTSA